MANLVPVPARSAKRRLGDFARCEGDLGCVPCRSGFCKPLPSSPKMTGPARPGRASTHRQEGFREALSVYIACRTPLDCDLPAIPSVEYSSLPASSVASIRDRPCSISAKIVEPPPTIGFRVTPQYAARLTRESPNHRPPWALMSPLPGCLHLSHGGDAVYGLVLGIGTT
jgi:hypothetical protein